VTEARAGDLAQVSSRRFTEPVAALWSNNTVRVMARDNSAATFELPAATLSVGVTDRRDRLKRRVALTDQKSRP
jgi:hypothetical protein